MTIDDLIAAYIEARNAVEWEAEKRGLLPLTNEMNRAGVTAIVRVLRDETCGNIESNQSAAEAWAIFEAILGDAGEKVAGNNEGYSHAEPSPATDTMPPLYKMLEMPDAAPAVCVWTGEEYVTYSTSCESEHEVDPHKAPPTYCPSCGLPIAFTEAK